MALAVLASGIQADPVAPPAVGSASAPLVSAIEKDTHLVDGCSCTLFERPNWNARDSQPIFVSDIRGHTAWMNIAGNTESLTLFFLQEPDRPGRKGDRLRRSYWSSGTRVVCDFTVTSVCDGKSECDGFGVTATISVIHGSQRTQLHGYGVCAC